MPDVQRFQKQTQCGATPPKPETIVLGYHFINAANVPVIVTTQAYDSSMKLSLSYTALKQNARVVPIRQWACHPENQNMWW